MRVRIVRLPFLLPPFAVAQVLLPNTIFVRRGVQLTVDLVAHELVHVQQLNDMGLLSYWTSYVWLWVWHGYAWHPMEVKANQQARVLYAEAGALIARYA